MVSFVLKQAGERGISLVIFIIVLVQVVSDYVAGLFLCAIASCPVYHITYMYCSRIESPVMQEEQFP